MNIPGIKDALGKLAASLPDLPFPALESMLADFASAFTQEARLVSLQIGDGKTYGNRLLPQTLEGREALSEAYKYEVTCLSPDAFIPLDGLLGLDAQVDLLTAGGGQLTRCGLIMEAEALPSDGGFARYKLVIEPPVALLRHRTTSRVFQDISVPDIVQQVLDEHIAANPAIGSILKLKFDLSKEYPARSYCLQYRETDLAFIERLLFEEGICYRWGHTSGDVPNITFIAFDDPHSLPQAAHGTVRFHRAAATESEDSLTEWTQARRIGPALASLTSYDYKPVRTDAAGIRAFAWDADEKEESVPAEASLEDFDAQALYYSTDIADLHRYAGLRQEAHDRLKGGYRAEGNVRELIAGEWFSLADHPAFDRLPEEEREFVACTLAFCAHNNLPQSLNKRLHHPGATRHPSSEGNGSGIIPLQGRGGGEADGVVAAATNGSSPPPPYWLKLSLRRRGLPLTPAYAHTRHARPTAIGIQTATVTGPSGEEVYTDEMGRIKIQFHWQRRQEHPNFGAGFDERSSCWVRVAYPSAGAAWGTQHIPRIGQEVLVSFIENDIDRPIVTATVHNGAQINPWFSEAGSLPANRTLSGVKSKEHFGQQYNELLFDDTTGQVRAKLSSEHGKTQLNQGFLTHPRRDGDAEPRGDGFELRTDHHGAVRAAEGLLLSTETRPGATGKQLDRDNAQAQLDAGRAMAVELSRVAQHQQAAPTEIGPKALGEEGQTEQETGTGHIDHLAEAARAWEAGTNTAPDGATANGKQRGRQAVLLASAPNGMGLTTPQEMALVAGQNLDTVSLRDTQQTTARRWIHNAGKKISLFVDGAKDKMNLKLTTAKGHANLWAQSGDVEVVGDQNVSIHADNKKQLISAADEILLACAGAYIRLKGGKIDVHCPGTLSMKYPNYKRSGATSMKVPPVYFPVPGETPNWIAVSHKDPEGQPMAGQKYKIHFNDGTVLPGELDAQGKARHEAVPERAEWVEYEPREPLPDEPWPTWDEMMNAGGFQTGKGGKP